MKGYEKMIHDQNIPIYHYRVRKDFKKLLFNWNWELFITLSFIHKVTFGTAIKETKTWLKHSRQILEKIRYAGIIQVVHYLGDNPHIHVLLTSDPAYPRTLKDLDWVDELKSPINLMESSWDLSKIGTCKIIPVYDNAGVCRYLARPKNFITWDSDRWDFHCYRPNLLKKLCKGNLPKFLKEV